MADIKTLADGTTGTGSQVTLTAAEEPFGVYISGLSSDTVTVQYRPTTSDSWVDAEGLKSIDTNKLDILQFVPGEYKLTRSGTGDSVTVKMVVR